MVDARSRWVQRLKRVLRDMPDDVWFWAADGRIYLMEKDPNGKHAMVMKGEYASVDPRATIDAFDVDASGGDW